MCASQSNDRAADDGLEFVPRSVRDKLDRVGLKVHLKDWQQMTISERARLRDLPCANADEVARYAAEVEGLVVRITGNPPDRLPRRGRA